MNVPSPRRDAGEHQVFADHSYVCVLVVFEFFFPDKAVFDSVENVGVVARSIEIIACT